MNVSRMLPVADRCRCIATDMWPVFGGKSLVATSIG